MTTLTKDMQEKLERMSTQMTAGGILPTPCPLAIPPMLFASPIDLPEGKAGKIRVRHRTLSKEVAVIGIRQAWNRGIRPVTARLQEPLRYHVLEQDGRGTWMTDLPEELFQIVEMMETVKPRRRVFVGGLGLGVLVATLLKIKAVSKIQVVELNRHVIKLCDPRPYLNAADAGRVKVLHFDMYRALEQLEEFDYYLLDTWQGTGEMTWWGEVMPARRIIRNRFGTKPTIHCWAEDIMLGQVVRALQMPFSRWYYEGLAPMTAAEAQRFVVGVGSPTWEKKYGAIVDKALERYGNSHNGKTSA